MASGILGQTNLTTASTWTAVYTVPAGKVATVNINTLNYGSSTARVDLALSTQVSTPTAAEYIEFSAAVSGFEVLERGGFVLEAGRKIYVRSTTSSPTIAVTVTGYEE